jgi:plastocyanin
LLEVVGMETDPPPQERRGVDMRQSGSRGRRGILAGIPAALVGALLMGCGGSDGASALRAPAGTGETITLRATDFAYTPAQVKVAAPGDVTIKLENKGLLEHDFMIEGVPGKLLVKANQTGSETFKIAKPGTYTFSCTVAGHREAGMKGTLVVG